VDNSLQHEKALSTKDLFLENLKKSTRKQPYSRQIVQAQVAVCQAETGTDPKQENIQHA
jgi:hypothetical protein